MASDLDQLVAMGFDKERAELSVKQTGGLQGALDWLDKNQDKSMDQIRSERDAAAADAADAEPPALQPGEEARSLACDDCGKRFRSVAQAEFHASKSGHENFSESTEEIKPLTEEEKQQRLDEMRAKLADKRKLQVDQDKVDRKKNEQIRMKATKESQDIKEDLQKKERLKEAMAKKREKQDEADARKRVLAKLEEDKAQRRRKAEAEKAARAGQAPPPPAEPSQPSTAGPTTSKPASAYAEARLALQTPTGRATKTYPAETTLFEVAQALEQDGVAVSNFTQNFPKKIFSQAEFSMTLREAGMVPSAALIVK